MATGMEAFIETADYATDLAADIGLYWEVGISPAAAAIIADAFSEYAEEPGREEMTALLTNLAHLRDTDPTTVTARITLAGGSVVVAQVLDNEDDLYVGIMTEAEVE